MTVLRNSARTIAIALALIFPGRAAPQGKPFVDCDLKELTQAVPELSGLQPAPNQDDQETVLEVAGQKLHVLFAKLAGFSAAESIHEMRYEDSMAESGRRENFRYLIRPLPEDSPDPFEEIRKDVNSGATIKFSAQSDFLVSGNFFHLLRYLLPEYREQSRFRYLGRLTAAGHDYRVMAFAEQPRGRDPVLQGLVWIDSANNRIARLRVSALGKIEDILPRTMATDISLAAVNFPSLDAEFLLPIKITVHASYARGEVHSVHRYSDWRLQQAATPDTVDTSADDAWELLDRGISLTREDKAAQAIEVLHKALGLDPEMSVARFHLAAALRAAGDVTGAEAELREVLKRLPDSGPAHNFLGILIFKRGDAAGAVEQFRTSVRLQPGSAIGHFNLAQALEKQGDRKAALEQYQAASTLAPDNAAFKERYEQFGFAANAPPKSTEDSRIKVDVQQVLVPVVVTSAGHHVTGLTQADFKVFEDGVEQKIAGFSVENIGSSAAADAPSAAVAAVAAAAPAGTPATQAASEKPPPIHRTYLICIDSFHSAFGDLAHVRDALTKRFQAEQPGDAQYILVSIGASMQVLQAPTTDPAAILKAIANKDFGKVFLASRQSSTQMDLSEFRRALDDARNACDHHDPSCEPLKRSLPPRANAIATQERVETLNFLAQFRSLVQMLARGTERRSIILVSDGFLLVPGKLALELVPAYFPELSSLQLRATDRMNDLEPILRLAANSNIPIYTIDSRGLYTPAFFDAANSGGTAAQMPAVLGLMNQTASEAGDALSEIAAATGGTFFQNSNNILSGIERAFADGRQYYLIAYVPSAPKSDGKFHAISVRVRDSKVVVSAKRGYWATAN